MLTKVGEQQFSDYLYSVYPSKNSRTCPSYLKAIEILDQIFQQADIFNLNSKSLTEIRDPYLISEIIDFVAEEEDKFRRGEDSIFKYGKPTQKSYPQKRFCTAAIRQLGRFINITCGNEATGIMLTSRQNGTKLSKDLMKKYRIDDKGTDKEVRAKHRIGQEIFRAILLEVYESKCCLTGIDVREVLRASHIIPWSESASTRLNPENGLCLSATYDAAFDRHLISFDEDYRLILSPVLKDHYTSEAFKRHFRNYEGTKISMPKMYSPSQKFMERHRSKLVV